MRELTAKMVMEEGTSNEDHTPPDELMSDNEVILYEITDEPVDSPVQEPINEEETRPREKKLKQSRIGDFFSKNNSSCSYNANKMSLYGTGRYFYAFKSIYDGFGSYFSV